MYEMCLCAQTCIILLHDNEFQKFSTNDFQLKTLKQHETQCDLKLT